MERVEGFDAMSEMNASRVIYHRVLPAVEAVKVTRARPTEEADIGSDGLDEHGRYTRMRNQMRLFNIRNVQRAFRFISDTCESTARCSCTCSGLRRVVEHGRLDFSKHTRMTSGELIMAVLLCGHPIRVWYGSTFLKNPHLKIRLKHDL